MRFAKFAVMAIGMLATPVCAAHAATATIVNGSFEEGSIDPGSFTTLFAGSTDITGWTVVTANDTDPGSVDYIGTYWTASDGSRSLDLDGNAPGGVQQTITGLTIGQQYTITFDLAGNPDLSGKKILQLALDGITQDYTFINTAITTKSAMGWILESFIFTASNTSQLLTFSSLTSDAWGPALDNVNISATPVPPALPLFAVALALLGWLGGRKQSSRSWRSPLAFGHG
ncbi:MAG: choice-of-anchor C family protein [Hyphomicrobium sp.]|uniref:choice-of-anchor C family protein n=1 Tax=Hyphomicrobium sp. TaxID=82 RepID=UPI0039E6C0C4